MGFWALPELSQQCSGRTTSQLVSVKWPKLPKQIRCYLGCQQNLPTTCSGRGVKQACPKPGDPQEYFASRQNINTSLLKSTKQGSLCSWPQRRFWSPAGCSLACRWRRTSHWARQCDPVAQDRLTRKWLITKWPVTLAESRVRASVGSHWLGWTGLCCAC